MYEKNEYKKLQTLPSHKASKSKEDSEKKAESFPGAISKVASKDVKIRFLRAVLKKIENQVVHRNRNLK